MAHQDTICALASGAPPSAIAVIRISGPAVKDIMETRMEPCRLSARHMTRARLWGPEGAIIDDGLAAWFPGPASYTGEDLLELYLHGGRAVVEDAMDSLLSVGGVRLAEPGEFTRRAFEAGKLDLTQAEGIADLIDAETRAQREQAYRQLSGHLSGKFSEWRRILLEALALVEVAVDFPDEEEAPDYAHGDVRQRIGHLHTELTRALDDGALGEKVRDGFRIAIIGAPNAGKSSLLNRLAGRDAAIVTDRPGTTRDIVEVRLDLGGHLVWLQDTAGLRESDDVIEAEGIRRARAAAESADLRLFVRDGMRPAADAASPEAVAPRPGDLVVSNKADLVPSSDVSRETLRVSALTGEGMDTLVERLTALIPDRIADQPPPLITRRRHRERLREAREHLAEAGVILEREGLAELAAEEIRLAIRALSQLLGSIGVEEVLGEVFSRFCIGK